MGRWLVLDSGPLGQLTQAAVSPVADWGDARLAAGDLLVVPEIADYEVRRELLRASLGESVTRLDHLGRSFGYLQITTADMRLAATLWAQARARGQATAPDLALDGDVILAAQALGAAASGRDVIVVTGNRRHLERYVPAQAWEDIG